ncbi:hypothetical protein M3Y97_00384300 [Aphelenchoides bicaudatus]|nr:hypothetical protein M3Y97_00384300 [Aphelenchoides bicaudatus]
MAAGICWPNYSVVMPTRVLNVFCLSTPSYSHVAATQDDPKHNHLSMNRTNSLSGGVVEKHANMRAYLKHRQRVLEMKPRVDNARPRSKSVSRMSTAKPAETAEQLKIQDENMRLLGQLIQISKRKSDLGSYTSSSYSRSKSCSRSSVSSANSTPVNQAAKR